MAKFPHGVFPKIRHLAPDFRRHRSQATLQTEEGQIDGQHLPSQYNAIGTLISQKGRRDR